jgi:hypothetical protein
LRYGKRLDLVSFGHLNFRMLKECSGSTARPGRTQPADKI